MPLGDETNDLGNAPLSGMSSSGDDAPEGESGMVIVPVVFRFGAANAGQTVFSQVLAGLPAEDGTYAPLEVPSAGGVQEAGSGQYACTFGLPPGVYYLRGILQGGQDAGLIDEYAVIAALPGQQALSPVLGAQSITVLSPVLGAQ